MNSKVTSTGQLPADALYGVGSDEVGLLVAGVPPHHRVFYDRPVLIRELHTYRSELRRLRRAVLFASANMATHLSAQRADLRVRPGQGLDSRKREVPAL